MPVLNNDKRLSFNLPITKETASLLREGLDALPPEKRRNVVYKKLVRDLDVMLTVWERTIKNEIIVQEQKRKIAAEKKAKKPTDPRPS
jgi:hypothetical protein